MNHQYQRKREHCKASLFVDGRSILQHHLGQEVYSPVIWILLPNRMIHFVLGPSLHILFHQCVHVLSHLLNTKIVPTCTHSTIINIFDTMYGHVQLGLFWALFWNWKIKFNHSREINTIIAIMKCLTNTCKLKVKVNNTLSGLFGPSLIVREGRHWPC